MAHAGVNVYHAEDLLKQAVAQNSARHELGDSRMHDHSSSPTPSGVETPRPDFHDKRSPGIMPGYFVGQPARRASASSIGSLVVVERATGPTPPPEAAEAAEGAAAAKAPAPEDRSRLPPTPISSAASVIQREGDSAETGLLESGFQSIAQALRNFVLPKSTFGGKARRHQSLPVSSVTRSTVPAAHISNPASSSPSPPSPPSPSPSSSSPPSPSPPSSPAISHPSGAPPPQPQSSSEGNGLTLDAAPRSRAKATPPHTPRALSQEDRPQSPLASDAASSEADKQSGRSAVANLPSASTRGKLAVKIAEGRNIKPAFDPYVVCVFEYNEPMAIPTRSRQSSANGMSDAPRLHKATDPQWDHEAVFDVTGRQSELDVSVYDRHQDTFLGHVRLCLNLTEKQPRLEGFFALGPRGPQDTDITGEIHITMQFSKSERRPFGPNDFQILKLIGKGTFGQVYQVRKKDTQRIYAMKVLSKKVIIQKKEIQHTIGERNILVRTAMADSPFIVGLKFSFQTPTDLYLVTDFMSGGELFWHLQKEGRFKEDRAKFYIAELILALKHLHEHDIVYRDLKPENILLDANGHIALCDFGLSKANLTKNDTTNTFCGTTEYLAPEVLLDEQGYTKMVDFWSLGVLVFEMCCGWSPFYAEDTQQMYKNIAFGKVRFPRDALSTEGRNFVKGLLNRNPKHRLGASRDAAELMEHPFFADVDWEALAKKNLVPPFKPKLSSQADTSNFDPEFTNALNTSSSLNARAAALAGNAAPASTPLSPTMQNAFRGFTFVDESTFEHHLGSRGDADALDDRVDDTASLSRSRTKDTTKDHRMSGLQRTGTHDDAFFQAGEWEQ
ncbi:hypothetical protein DV737_g5780, partial [Chaetothyriales sp. CBS 132003]